MLCDLVKHFVSYMMCQVLSTYAFSAAIMYRLYSLPCHHGGAVHFHLLKDLHTNGPKVLYFIEKKFFAMSGTW